MQISLVAISLATVCVEWCLYGLFFALFCASMYALILRQRSFSAQPKLRQVSSSLMPLILSSVLIFIFVTADVIFVFIRLFQAFMWYKNGSAPLEFYANLSQPTEVAKGFIIATAVVIADAMIIYRLWIVWSYNNAIIIFPTITLFGATVCGIGTTYQLTRYDMGENIFNSQTGRWITSLSCIAGRIIKINQKSISYGGASLTSIVAIIIESAAIYTTWTTFFFISYLSKSNLQFIGADCWSVISGISFMLINVRVALGWAQSGRNEPIRENSPPEFIGMNSFFNKSFSNESVQNLVLIRTPSDQPSQNTGELLGIFVSPMPSLSD
ncbi:hypothetical protein BDQ12DRAFT_700743 [Crucibulum laeve]|uniref:Uncharacterized protein n=1 Tax=Crucibulum laeve TaxID=68775 RepID=A0A5C3LLU5_9AGAR|nr:hypothetical protein BDQ12DRAFT_700743 [Crucibulum laeve]